MKQASRFGEHYITGIAHCACGRQHALRGPCPALRVFKDQQMTVAVVRRWV